MKIGNLRILVSPKQKNEKEQKIGSIIVPGSLRHKKTLTEGIVIECGTGTPDILMEVKVGDTVLFHDADSRIKVDNNILLEMNDILMVILNKI